MRFTNYTKISSITHINEDAKGNQFEIVILKATYRFDPDFKIVVQKEQEPLNFTDHCYEDFNTSSLMYPSDLVPYKPKTDIIIIANTSPPSGNPVKRWNCGVRVEGEHVLEKKINVCGPRQWIPKWSRNLDDEQKKDWQKYKKSFKGWELSEPEPVTSVPMRYEYAYGGMQTKIVDGEEQQIAYEYNPIGTGWIDPELTDHTKPMPAPQFEAEDEPITDPYKQYSPQCLGPIPPAWLPRRPLGGTYDQNWIDNIWPHWAPDYDFAFHNSAPIHLQYPGHMQGNERIELLHLWPKKPLINFKLPNHVLYADYIGTDGEGGKYPLPIDTIFIDVTSGNIEEAMLTLTWRFPYVRERTKTIKIRSNFSLYGTELSLPDQEFLSAQNPNQLFSRS